jgi:hypothetical protein
MKKIITFTVLLATILTLTACDTETTILDYLAENETEITLEDTPYDDDSSIILDTDSDETYGSLGALSDLEYTLEEMLIYAIQDEYAARAEYEYILNTFDVTTPFSNIIKSEETHISLLLPLFEEFDLIVPEDTSSEHLINIDSLEETYSIGVIAEEYNIAMYNAFLAQDDLPDSVVDVFIKLRDASLNHLAAFTKNANNS